MTAGPNQQTGGGGGGPLTDTPIVSSTPQQDPTAGGIIGPALGATGANQIGGALGGFVDMLQTLFPQMPFGFIVAAAQAWAQFADEGMDFALATLRQDARYDTWFPGNLAADGSAHVSEGAYWSVRTQYEGVIAALQLDPQIFSDDQYIALIQGDVKVDEFETRVRRLSNDILQRADGIRAFYAELFDIEGITDAAILETAFSGSTDALLRGIGITQVGFEGELRGFDIDLTLASSLFDANITTPGAAAELFGQAASSVPLFGRLAERHFDPDDTFDLGEFIEAAVFDDTEQLSRINRLLAQERSDFSNFQPLRRRRDGGQVVGLLPE